MLRKLGNCNHVSLVIGHSCMSTGYVEQTINIFDSTNFSILPPKQHDIYMLAKLNLALIVVAYDASYT